MWSVKRQRLQVALMEQEVVVVDTTKPQGNNTWVLPTNLETGQTGSRWAPALATLEQWLQDHPQNGAQMLVHLSAQLVRWQCLPWPLGLVQPEALQAYAQARMQATFGAAAAQWRLLTGAPQPGHTVVACAIDEALLVAVQTLCTTHHLKLDHVGPYFAAAHDHWHPQLRRGKLWFVGLEPGAMTLGLLHQGRWLGLRSVRLAGDHATGWLEVLAALQRQMRISCGLEADENLPVLVSGAVPVGQHPALGHRHLVPAAPGEATVEPAARLAWGV